MRHILTVLAFLLFSSCIEQSHQPQKQAQQDTFAAPAAGMTFDQFKATLPPPPASDSSESVRPQLEGARSAVPFVHDPAFLTELKCKDGHCQVVVDVTRRLPATGNTSGYSAAFTLRVPSSLAGSTLLQDVHTSPPSPYITNFRSGNFPAQFRDNYADTRGAVFFNAADFMRYWGVEVLDDTFSYWSVVNRGSTGNNIFFPTGARYVLYEWDYPAYWGDNAFQILTPGLHKGQHGSMIYQIGCSEESYADYSEPYPGSVYKVPFNQVKIKQ